MCGIAAILAYGAGGGQRADRRALDRTAERLAPRGPDGAGVWCGEDQRVMLAHRRLAIIDLSARAAQPMRTADDSAVISYNGEIYNHGALRAELERKGYVFRTQSDTEVLLHLYADRGDAMVSALRGMFAFIVWDARRRELVLARDGFGIKPLYYADGGGVFRAASEVKALVVGGDVDTAPDPAGHVGFFLWGHVPEPYTTYRGVRSLPAGTVLRVGIDGRRSSRSFASARDIIASADRGAGQAAGDGASTLRAAVADSVRHHLIADVEVGVFLSAGLDSTTILALAMEAGGRLRTVTLGFEEFRGGPLDETPEAERVAAYHGSRHTTVWMSRRQVDDAMERLLDRMDVPTTDGINAYFVAAAAAASGLKVALSGIGGDELFGGYPSFAQIPRLVSVVRRLPGRGASSLLRRAIAAALPAGVSAKYAGLLEYGGDYGRAFLLRRALFMPWELSSVVEPELLREGLEQLDTDARLSRTIEGLTTPHARVAALESTWYMRDRLLRDTDWASMSHSVEVRVPLVDGPLWSAVAPFVFAGELTKQSLAGTPARPLPADLLGKPKRGFVVPTPSFGVAGIPHGRLDRGLRGWARYLRASAT